MRGLRFILLLWSATLFAQSQVRTPVELKVRDHNRKLEFTIVNHSGFKILAYQIETRFYDRNGDFGGLSTSVGTRDAQKAGLTAPGPSYSAEETPKSRVVFVVFENGFRWSPPEDTAAEAR